MPTEEFNLFKVIHSIPKKEEVEISTLLLGSLIWNILEDEDLTYQERIEKCKMELTKHGLD